MRLIGSGKANDGALKIHQDVDLYATVLEPGHSVRLDLRPGRHAWAQVIRGDVSLNGRDLHEGDGAAVSEETTVELTARTETEFLIFDLA